MSAATEEQILIPPDRKIPQRIPHWKLSFSAPVYITRTSYFLLLQIKIPANKSNGCNLGEKMTLHRKCVRHSLPTATGMWQTSDGTLQVQLTAAAEKGAEGKQQLWGPS